MKRPPPSSDANRTRRRGFSLVELLIATALATIVLGSLTGVVLGALQAQGSTREGNEMAYEARFALGRIVARAEATTAKPTTVAPALTTGDWFAPTMYCVRAATRQLIETVPADSGCNASGGRVIADNVSNLSVQLAAGGPFDRPLVTITLSLANASGTRTFTPLVASVRLGGAAP